MCLDDFGVLVFDAWHLVFTVSVCSVSECEGVCKQIATRWRKRWCKQQWYNRCAGNGARDGCATAVVQSAQVTAAVQVMVRTK